MFRVTRAIHFSYGHRLLNHPGKCARLHGHNGRVLIEVSSQLLNNEGMVMDFYEIKESIGVWIDETLDHRTILYEKDPLVAVLQKAGEKIVVMKENPTAEALAKWIFNEARHRRIPVSRVTLWETENSYAVYHE
jgi:6-pyruvoyltetrahydropterin/6-carboxytetrahydropterin synthase